MVTLKTVDIDLYEQLVDMELPDEQRRFVATNVESFADAWICYDIARPFAVCNDDEVVGFMMLDWDEGERSVGLWRFMIAYEHQHKGYGRAALEYAIDMVRKSENIDMMYLSYVEGNDIASSLYYSLGFRKNGKIEDGEIVMTLPLTDCPKVGMLTADKDDVDDIKEVLNEIGDDIPDLSRILSEKKVKRLTLMGETIGVFATDKLFIKPDMASYTDEAKKLLGI